MMKPKLSNKSVNLPLQTAETQPDYWRLVITLLVMLLLFLGIPLLMQMQTGLAAEDVWHRLPEERPGNGRLVYIPLGDCLHLARFQFGVVFYDQESDRVFPDETRWLYPAEYNLAAMPACRKESHETG